MIFCSATLGCKVNQYETRAIESLLCGRGHEVVNPGAGCDVCIINTCAVTSEGVRKSRQAIRRMKKLEPGAFIAVFGCFSQLEPEAAEQLGADLIGGTSGRNEFAVQVEELVLARRCGGGNVEVEELASRCGGVSPEKLADVYVTTVSHSDKSCKSAVSPCGGGNVDVEELARRYGGIDPEKLADVYVTTDPHSDELGESSASPCGGGAARSTRLTSSGSIPPHRLAPLFEAEHKFEALSPGSSSERTRALLKIQDGCDNFCTYCVVPYARGHSRSLPPDLVAEYAGILQEQGYKEIVITGIEISSYQPSLDEAVRIIHAAAPHARLRLGSLDPAIVTDEFCVMLSEIPKICDHFHLSLQSGCDELLSAMGRKYGAAQVLEAIQALRNRFPDCAITTDLICGFPGETDAQFEETMRLIKEASFSDMHIFPFSARPGTKAAQMPGQIKKSIKRERARIAAETAALMANRFKHSQIGKTVEVLFEQCKNGLSIGHSSNYLKIAVKTKVERNSMHKVKITGIENDVMIGRLEGECSFK